MSSFTRGARRILALSLALAAFAAVAQSVPRPPAPLTVVFEDCTEFAGLGPLPAEQIQGLVPAGYSPASFGPGVAGIVARAARCERVSVGGSAAERGTISQIGINLVSPDGTGDINNYALLYVTDSVRLAERLRRFGLPARLDPKMVYEVNPAAASLELFIQVHGLEGQSHFLHGSVADPQPGTEFPFLANWWFTGGAGRMRMSTQIPAFGAGPADVALYTARASDLGAVLAANRTVFPLLSLRGKFSHAVMTVTLAQ
ncbi:MAG: hypothetical protein ABIQ06_14315 [Caldimonas sp.]